MKKTSKHVNFHNYLAGMGCVICGDPGNIHHCVGRKARHKKKWIGEIFVICLCPSHHQYGELAVHSNPVGFARLVGCEKRLEAEKLLFFHNASSYGVDIQDIDIIMDYHK